MGLACQYEIVVKAIRYAYRGGPYQNGPMSTTHQDWVKRVLGSRLRAARVRAGFKSAQQFAHRLGLEPGTYRCYERGQAEPSLANLVRICAELDITIDHLLPPKKAYPLPLAPSDQEPSST